MAVYEFEGRVPKIGPGTYIHPSAEVIGLVTLGVECWVGPGARIRGDYGEVVVGDGTSIEDNCVVHARPGESTHIGRHVTLGHGCVVHNATVSDYAVIGMGAVVSDWAMVGEWAVIGEGAVVTQRQDIPEQHIAVGVPAKVLENRWVSEGYQDEWMRFKNTYRDLARRYPSGLKRIDG
ncbi:MAG: gamma carbonic anhydrase family protein [Chloroflexi bacterium]|nr:gamma carbonic anhydrase family protein [Chloroflexota bacterium]